MILAEKRHISELEEMYRKNSGETIEQLKIELSEAKTQISVMESQIQQQDENEEAEMKYSELKEENENLLA